MVHSADDNRRIRVYVRGSRPITRVALGFLAFRRNAYGQFMRERHQRDYGHRAKSNCGYSNSPYTARVPDETTNEVMNTSPMLPDTGVSMCYGLSHYLSCFAGQNLSPVGTKKT
jgi:hypothetical protein